MLDNGSDSDLMQETAARLKDDTSLTRVAIVSVPFPYGGKSKGRFVVPAKYLQVAMLNTMRARFLGQARGLLSVDVDEFVEPFLSDGPHKTIFDLARARAVGCVTFTGRWAFAPHASGPQPQRVHDHTDPEATCDNPKWCMVPGGWADRFALAVHRPAGPLFGLTRSRSARYWHFRATTTGWKTPRFETSPTGHRDPALVTAMQHHLP